MTTATKRFHPKNSNKVTVSAYLIEDFLNEVIDLSHKGFVIDEGTTVATTQYKTVNMTKYVANTEAPEDLSGVSEETLEVTEEITQEEPENVSEEELEVITGTFSVDVSDSVTKEETVEDVAPTVDDETIASFNGDKIKLEDYGKTFGIDLKRTKTFKNMVKDLKNHVEGS